jgi:hypothetical protein
MRRPMERLDALVAGIGILVVAVALGGVLAAGPGGNPTFQVAFVEQREALEAQQASFAGEGSQEVTFVADVINATRLEVVIRVTGAGPRAGADALEFVLTGPDGRSETLTGTLPPGASATASVTFTREVQPVPPAQAVRAATPDEAVAAARPPSGGIAATGAYTVEVVARGSGLLPAHVETHAITVEPTVVGLRGVVQPEGSVAR